MDKIHVSLTKIGESPQFGAMIDGASAQRILTSKANRTALKGKYKDGILRKAVRNRLLSQPEKRFIRQISKRHFRFEQYFGKIKRLFGLHRARYFGAAKTNAHMVMVAISQNLLKAANKITLNQQTVAIA